jgi:hypothetical protein
MSTPPHFQLGAGIWASIPGPAHNDLLQYFIKRARELLARLPEYIPDDDRLRVIVKAAMEARALYFVAAMTEPTTDHLDGYFDHFVICSIFGIPDFNEAHYENYSLSIE